MTQGDDIRQVGYVTIGHGLSWAADGVVRDSGPATAGNLTELGITQNANIALGINSGPITGPYTRLSFEVEQSVGATIALDSFNGAAPGELIFSVNGGNFVIPSNGMLPLFTATTQGEVPASGGSTSAFLRADGNWAVPPGGGGGGGSMVGPATSVDGDLVSFSGTTGQVAQDSGILASSVVVGPGSAAPGNIASFNGASGRIVQDSAISPTNISISCLATGTNQFTLTPLAGNVIPPAYVNYQTFRFAAPSTSSGPVTLKPGPLAQLPLYNSDGRTQAGSVPASTMDIIANAVYTVAYNSALGSGAGGFQILDGPVFQITAAPQIFVGLNSTNVQSTLSSFVVNGNSTTAAGSRQFLISSYFNSTTGAGQGANTGDRVTFYGGINGAAGSGDIWAFNTVTNMSAAFPNNQNAFGYELDFNNLARHCGEATLGAGFAAPVAYGLAVTGAGSFRSTAAILVSGPGAPLWNRGIAFVNNSVAQASIQDLSASAISYQVAGVHARGIDLTLGSFSGFAVGMPNNGLLTWLNGAGNGFVTDYVDVNNNRTIGAGAAGISSGNHFFPSTGGVFQLGLTSARWQNVHTQNVSLPNTGVIQWLNQANTGQIFDQVDANNTRLVGVNATNVVMGTHTWPVADGVSFLGLPGQRWNSVYALNGVIQTSDPAQKRDIAYLPAMRRVLHMIDPRTYQWIDDEPGAKRTHWGFLAPEVKTAMATTGMDFGGYVKDPETGLQQLRPDQLLAVLWKAVQEMDVELRALRARLA